MLGAYFLKEELGTLGKLGCAICLIGSVIIVLHAPPDGEIETVDRILDYAIQPGMRSMNRVVLEDLLTYPRLSLLLCRHLHFPRRHDLQSRAVSWQEEPPRLHLDMLGSRIYHGHVREGFWNRPQTHLGQRWEKSVLSSLNIRLRHCRCGVHPDTDELFQQGFEPVLYLSVSRSLRLGILCS